MRPAGEPSPRQSAGSALTQVGSFAYLDALHTDALAVFCWSDVRPLKGVAGLLDWRLCGALSRPLQAGHFRGDVGEALLLPASGRLRVKRLFLFGLGPRQACTREVMEAACRRAQAVLRQAGAREIFLAAPQDSLGRDSEARFAAAALESCGDTLRGVLVGP